MPERALHVFALIDRIGEAAGRIIATVIGRTVEVAITPDKATAFITDFARGAGDGITGAGLGEADIARLITDLASGTVVQ